MTRVLQVMAGADKGGAEAFFVRLVTALQRAGLDQRAAIRTNAARAAALRAAGVDTIELPFGGWFDFTTGPALKRVLADYRPDIALTWMSRATQRLPRSPAIHVARLGGYYDFKHYRRCDHLIANTAGIADHLVQGGIDPARVHVLRNFVDAVDAMPVDRAGLDTPADAKVVLAMGRLHENKAFDVLLAAVARIEGAWLWLAGSGPEDAALKAQAARLGIAGRVRFLGWRDDGGALLASADVLVCSSRHEPLGNVVLEAWAARRPVVAAASAGPAMLIVDGESGLLAPVDDAVALADAIGRVLSDAGLAGRLAEAGHTAWAQGYTEDRVVAAYLDFFRRIKT
ncbi:MAG: glycosyltransferase [Alphaproteobacteria bacterium]|nr:glycosyltransferase [Alphaproteobacteria bacterium]